MASIKSVFVALLSLSTAVHAFEDDDLIALYDEEELISIATGTQKHIRFAPSVASVITSDEIERMGARTLDEALESVPGLHVAKSFNRQDPIYSIRGIHTGQNPQVLLLVDGVRVQQLFSGGRPYNFEMPVANIERIEVIRGPGSAVYGADAFAGVISVTTKTSQGIKTSEAGFRAGSFKTQDVWLQEYGEWGDVKVDFSIEYSTTDGDTDQVVNSDAQSIQPAGAMPSASLAPGSLSNDIEHWHTRLRFSQEHWSLGIFSWNLIDAGLGSGGAQALDPVGHDEADYYGLQFELQNIALGSDWEYGAHIESYIYDAISTFILYPPGASVDFDPDPVGTFFIPFPDGVIGEPGGLERSVAGESIFDFTGSAEHNLRFGVGFRYQENEASERKNFALSNIGTFIDVTGTDEVYIKDGSREHYYAYVQDEWAFSDDWEATIGLRYDTYTQFGDSFNPRVALVWATAHNLTSKILYGRAFRAPSFSELFTENNPALVGNPDLEPETIDTYEVAFDYRPSNDFAARLNFFYYEIDDLVEIQFGMPAVNAGEQSGHGFEYEVDWNLSENLNVVANYAWQQSENDLTDEDIPGAPGQQAFVNVNWKISDGRSLAIVANWVTDRKRDRSNPFETRGDIDDYTKVDAVLRSKTKVDGLEMAVIAKNLFDDDIVEPSGPNFPEDYPQEGRSLSVELVYDLDIGND